MASGENASSTSPKVDSNLCREDFGEDPISLDEIEKGLYLGNLTAATHLETLKSLNITHILTMDSVPLPAHIVQVPFLTTKYVHISDMPKEDILHHFSECNQFIESALASNQNVLVHCYFGVSRSSAVVIAYVMKKHNLEYSQAFERVKAKRRFVQPNSGFVFQLKLYRRMGCKIDRQYPKYKNYRLRLAADNVRKAKILPQMYMDVVKPDPAVTRENPDPLVYRCRKCRRVLATKSNLLSHGPKNQTNPTKDCQVEPTETNQVQQSEPEDSNGRKLIDHIADQIRKASVSERSSENEEETSCRSILFVEPIAWMKDILNQTQGRLNCPKCTQKLGSFSWINGCHCPCGVEVSPAFYLVPSKVELSHSVQNVQTTI